jgi:hypothetical protein
MPVDAAGTISGWGLFDAAQKTSDPLRETTLYVSGLTATHVTFTSTTHMSCPGDSGGPFVVDVNGTPKLAGVISWALGNTRVAPQDAWLQTVIYGPAPLWASARLSRVFIPLTVTR